MFGTPLLRRREYDVKFIDYWHANRQRYQALLFDIDGTLSCGSHVLPGVRELLMELRAEQVPHCILTNDGNHSQAEKSAILAAGGLTVAPEEIVSCGSALGELVTARGWRDRMFFVLGLLGHPCYAERAGLRVCRDENRIDECFGVINGEDYYDWHNHMQAAINFFRRHPDRPLVVPNPDSYWPGSRPGWLGVGAGGQARFICGMLAEMGVDIQPIYLGKPYRPVYDAAVHLLRRRFPEAGEFDYGRILMLGDSLQSDIRGANNCGMVSALLLTGITSAAQAARAEGDCVPHLIFDTIG